MLTVFNFFNELLRTSTYIFEMLTIRNMLSETVMPNMYLVVKKKWNKSEVMEKFPFSFHKTP